MSAWQIIVLVLFFLSSNTSDYNEAADVLTRLQIWKLTPMQSGLPGRLLNTTFQKSLQTSWLGGLVMINSFDFFHTL